MNMDYTYTHTQTLATTGYFSCEPAAGISEEDLLARLEACPMDDFLHLHLLRKFCKKPLDELKGRLTFIHIKDGFKGGEGKPLGQGEAPCEAVYRKAVEMGIPMVVESETLQPAGMTEAKVCIEFLKAQES